MASGAAVVTVLSASSRTSDIGRVSASILPVDWRPNNIFSLSKVLTSRRASAASIAFVDETNIPDSASKVATLLNHTTQMDGLEPISAGNCRDAATQVNVLL